MSIPNAFALTPAEENAAASDIAFSVADPEAYAKEKTKDVDISFINILNTLIAVISLIYVPFSMLSSWLLSPDWTFGDFIHLRPVLHSLWIFVSNTVYVVFAAMLIFVAIANIFGQSDSYAIKKMLPRFIIGVIMVPFTWWVVSASLSISSYMTALVLRMPADIINANQSIQTKVDIPTKCYLDFSNSDNSKKIWRCDDPPKGGTDLAPYLLESNGAYGIIPLYAYNIFKFNSLDGFKNILNSDSTKTEAFNSMSEAEQAQFRAGDNATKSALLQAAIIATGIGKIGVQLFMSVLFAIVFTVILIALVLVLFTRVIKMWMYAIFSPLFALRYFLSDKIDKDNALSKFDFKEFIGLAMVPVVVSAALGFGFMFIMTFKSHMEQTTPTGQQGIESPFIDVKKGATATGGDIQFFGTTINIKLTETNGAGVSADGSAVKAENLQAALFNVLSGLITPIFGIVILWMAVMAAMKTSAVAAKAVESIEGIGKMAGDFSKKLPGMIPVPGATYTDATTGKKRNINMKQLAMTPEIFKNWADTKESKDKQAMQQWLGVTDGLKDAAAAIRNAAQKSDAAGIWTKSMDGKSVNGRYKATSQQGNLLAMAEKMGIPVDEATKQKITNNNQEAFRDIEKKIIQALANDASLTRTQQETITTLASSWTGTTDDVTKLNKALNGDSNASEDKKPLTADAVTIGDLTTNRVITIPVGNGEQTTLNLSGFTKATPKDELQNNISRQLQEKFTITSGELEKLVNKIIDKLPA